MTEKRKKILITLIRSFKLNDATRDIEIMDNPDGLFIVKVNVEKIDLNDYGQVDFMDGDVEYQEEVYDDMESRMMDVADEVERIVGYAYSDAFPDDVVTDYPYIYVYFKKYY